MSTELMISLLDRASSGADILNILDTITAQVDMNQLLNSASEVSEPVLDSLEF
jgi:hypothetical protein